MSWKHLSNLKITYFSFHVALSLLKIIKLWDPNIYICKNFWTKKYNFNDSQFGKNGLLFIIFWIRFTIFSGKGFSLLNRRGHSVLNVGHSLSKKSTYLPWNSSELEWTKFIRQKTELLNHKEIVLFEFNFCCFTGHFLFLLFDLVWFM